MSRREPTTTARATAWVGVAVGVVLVQVGLIALTVRGVEADLTRTAGTPPLWQPTVLLLGLVLLASSGVVLLRHRRR